jgi:GR25 family glycosyltransferase involved in LPS biosynthesis
MNTPVYCITLREEPWKQRAAEAIFKEHGISAKFIYGFQGVTAGLKPSNPYDLLADGSGVFLHPATLGCLVSHRMALTLAIADGENDFIIVEDDVDFDPSFEEKHDEFKSIMRKDDSARAIQLEYCSLEGKTVDSIGLVGTCRPYPFCAAAIWWNRAAALTALSLMRPLDRSYDILLIEKIYPFVNHMIATPQMASQKSNHYGYPVGTTSWPSSIGTAMR